MPILKHARQCTVQMQCKLLVTLPAAGIETAPAACAAVHLYATPAFSSVMLCYKACNKQHICDAI